MQIQVLRLYLVGLELITISIACFGIIHFSGFDVGNINGSFGVVDKKIIRKFVYSSVSNYSVFRHSLFPQVYAIAVSHLLN